MRRGFRRADGGAALRRPAPAARGCRSGAEKGRIKYVIGVSQANMREPWRLVLIRELQEEAARHPEIRLVITDATADGEKQVEDIQRLLGYGIDLLIVSPHDVERITPVVSEVYQKIPVIVLDRVVEGYDYSLFIGPDNDLIGKQAGEAAVRLVRGSAAKVLELKGGPHSQASAERSGGFRSVTSLFPLIEIESVTVENESRDAAEDLVSAYGERLREFDVIFAHNDYMALGAYKAAHRLGCDDVKIVGIDGFTGQDGGLELIPRRQDRRDDHLPDRRQGGDPVFTRHPREGERRAQAGHPAQPRDHAGKRGQLRAPARPRDPVPGRPTARLPIES